MSEEPLKDKSFKEPFSFLPSVEEVIAEKESYSVKRIFNDSLLSFIPFGVGLIILIGFSVVSQNQFVQNYIFFPCVLLTVESWIVRTPFRFPRFYGNIILITALFLFSPGFYLALLGISVLFQYLSRAPQNSREWTYLIKRYLLLGLSSFAFGVLGLRHNEAILNLTMLSSSYVSLLFFIGWALAYGMLEIGLFFCEALITKGTLRLELPWSQWGDFLLANTILFPVMGYLGYYLFSVGFLWLSFRYVIFLLFIYLSYIFPKITSESLHIGVKFILVIAQATEERIAETASHSIKVSKLSESIAEVFRLTPEEIKRIQISALIQNIGYLGITDQLLKARRPLSLEELKLIYQHPLFGVEILKEFPMFKELLNIIVGVHERWDGKGYPKGRKGGKIPLSARIISVSDAAIAMRSPRPDRPALSQEDMLNEIQKNSGTQFDPKVVNAFKMLFSRGKISIP